jgi:hypothetical protein
MFHRGTLLATAAALLLARGALADSVKPLEARDIDLGSVTGTVYYTVDTDPFRVVATLQTVGEAPVPVRVISTLSPGQAVTLSTPRGVGEPAVEVRFVRRGNQVFVESSDQMPRKQALIVPERR